MQTKSKKIIKLLLIFSFFVFGKNIKAANTNFSHIKTGLVNYQQQYLTEPLKTQVTQWEAARFDFFEGGDTPLAYNPNAKWMGYNTIIGLYSYDLPQLDDFAVANGYSTEDVLLHMNIDYTARRAWTGMDKFDAFEFASGSTSNNVNGVLIEKNSVFTDKTTAAYNVTSADVTLDGDLYIGYAKPYDQVNFLISSAATSLQATWQYWNGSVWTDVATSHYLNNLGQSTLNSLNDGTNGLTVVGSAATVSFYPPSDWAKTAVNNSRQKYWTRLHYVSADANPVISRIYGDNWHVNEINTLLCRGWNAGAANIINKGLGELEYNPAPVAGALARFRYQARATGYWAVNYLFINPANIQNGKRPWSQFSADLLVNAATTPANPYYGVLGSMSDSCANTLSNGISVPATDPELSSEAGVTTAQFTELGIATYAETGQIVKQSLPSWLLGANDATTLRYLNESDWNFHEYWAIAANTNQVPARTTTKYDDYLPSVNPTGKFGVFHIVDLVSTRITSSSYDSDSGTVFWDRADRGPLTALTLHYIYLNDNTYFSYYTEGAYRYDETDDVFVYAPVTSNLNADLPRDVVSPINYIYGDFSAFPATTIVVRIGDETFNAVKVDNTKLQTSNAIYNSYPIGTVVKYVIKKHQSDGGSYALEDVYRWGNWFPAMGVDVGIPVGERNLNWNGFYRRDYSNAIIIHSPAGWNTTRAEFNSYKAAIDLGGTYYPLNANGTTGSGVTAIALRTGDGAILMKNPVGLDVLVPSAPSGLFVL